MRHEELKIMPDKIYLTVCPLLSYEKENKTCTHTCTYIYIHTEKIFEEINQNSKNNLGYMRYDCYVWLVSLYIFFSSQVLLV